MKLAIIILLTILALRAAAREPERETAANGETTVREFFDDDSPKSISHLDAKGKLLDTLYYAPKGIPMHLDTFDDHKHVTATQTLKDDGTPISKYRFDDRGNLTFVETLSYSPGKAADDAPPAADYLKFVTPGGIIGFTVNGTWKIIALQPGLPTATVGFQIPNPPDQNTPAPANFSLSLYDASSDVASKAAKKALGGLLDKQSGGKVKKTGRGDWLIWSYSGKLDKTSCHVLDASRKIGGVIVGAHLTWPKVGKSPATSDAGMDDAFLSVLDSVAEEK